MTPSELADEFRRQVNDQEEPPLWSPAEVLRYMVQAQDTLVRHVGGFADASTPELVRVPVKAGQAFAPISPYVLRVRSARLETAARDVKLIQEADLSQEGVADYGWRVGLNLSDVTRGAVTHGILGLEEKKVRWYRVPVEDDVCLLHVFRLPYPRLASLETGTLEVDEHHHYHLVLGMKHLAYSKQDAEARDDKQARDSEIAFRQYCEQARAENERRKYRPRVVQYGGL